MQPIPGSPPHVLMALLAHAQSPQHAAPPADPVGLLRQMMTLAHTYLQAEPDEQDKADFSKVLPLLQRLLAKDQSDQDALMGGSSPVVRALRKNT